jgi:hypothetical protein
MLRSIPAKLLVAIVVTVALVDLQLYVNRYYPRSDMFGSYLRRQVRDADCDAVARSPLKRCPEETQGTGRKVSPTKASSSVLRG